MGISDKILMVKFERGDVASTRPVGSGTLCMCI